jgi:urease accessory protein
LKGCVAMCAATLLLASAGALAHQETGKAIGFLSGFTHPISGLDHVVAMVAVGLWGAVLGAPAIWVLPVAFPVMMAIGGLAGLLGFPLPGVEIGIATSAIVLGAAVLTERRPSLWIAAIVVGIFAVFHGHAHGSELPPGENALLYSLGFVMATGMLHAIGILMGVAHRWSAGRQAIRAAGGGVALAGLFFLWKALA